MWKPLPPSALPTLILLLSARAASRKAASRKTASAKRSVAAQAVSERSIRMELSLLFTFITLLCSAQSRRRSGGAFLRDQAKEHNTPTRWQPMVVKRHVAALQSMIVYAQCY